MRTLLRLVSPANKYYQETARKINMELLPTTYAQIRLGELFSFFQREKFPKFGAWNCKLSMNEIPLFPQSPVLYILFHTVQMRKFSGFSMS